MATNFAILAGIDLEVDATTANRKDRPTGAIVVTYDNGLKDGRRPSKFEWEFVLAKLTLAEVATVRAATPVGVNTTLTGDCVGMVSQTVAVEWGVAPYRPDGTSFYMAPAVTVRQV
jgi:hypothetical protein